MSLVVLVAAFVAIVLAALAKTLAGADITTSSRISVLEAKVDTQQARINQLEIVQELIRGVMGRGTSPPPSSFNSL